MRTEGLGPRTLGGIEPGTLRFAAHCLNQMEKNEVISDEQYYVTKCGELVTSDFWCTLLTVMTVNMECASVER
jgi:hypothetical protein